MTAGNIAVWYLPVLITEMYLYDIPFNKHINYVFNLAFLLKTQNMPMLCVLAKSYDGHWNYCNFANTSILSDVPTLPIILYLGHNLKYVVVVKFKGLQEENNNALTYPFREDSVYKSVVLQWMCT